MVIVLFTSTGYWLRDKSSMTCLPRKTDFIDQWPMADSRKGRSHAPNYAFASICTLLCLMLNFVSETLNGVEIDRFHFFSKLALQCANTQNSTLNRRRCRLTQMRNFPRATAPLVNLPLVLRFENNPKLRLVLKLKLWLVLKWKFAYFDLFLRHTKFNTKQRRVQIDTNT